MTERTDDELLEELVLEVVTEELFRENGNADHWMREALERCRTSSGQRVLREAYVAWLEVEEPQRLDGKRTLLRKILDRSSPDPSESA